MPKRKGKEMTREAVQVTNCSVVLDSPAGSYLDQEALATFSIWQNGMADGRLTINKEQARKIGNMLLDFGGIKCECEGCTTK